MNKVKYSKKAFFNLISPGLGKELIKSKIPGSETLAKRGKEDKNIETL